MAPPRIDLADPSPEGQAIAEALRARGFHVVERTAASLLGGCDAALLLLAGDTGVSAGVLDALSASSAPPPVVLLGRPIESPEAAEVTSVRPYGADALYERPVAIQRLIRKVETFLAPPETRLAPALPQRDPEEGEAAGAAEDSDDATRRPHGDDALRGDEPGDSPERTMNLAEPGADEWGILADASVDDDEIPSDDDELADFLDAELSVVEVSGVAEVTGVSFRDDLPSIEEAAARLDADDPVSQVALRDPPRHESVVPRGQSAAELSPRLMKIFEDADRRVFPDSPPLDLELLDRQESARELVPDELLESVPLPVEMKEEDPLEAFTYVGAPPADILAPLPMSEAAHRFQPSSVTGEIVAPARPPRTEAGASEAASRPPRTVLEPEPWDEPEPASAPSHASPEAVSLTTDEITNATRGETTRENLEQNGDADEGEVLPFLLDIAGAEAAIDVRLTLPDGSRIDLGVAGRQLTRLVADAHVRVAEELHRQGRLDEIPADDRRAARVLEERIDAGLLGRFEADRLLRLAREGIIHDLVVAPGLHYEVSAAAGRRGGQGSLSTTPLAILLTEGARRRIDGPSLRHRLGGGVFVVELRDGLSAGGTELGVEQELLQLVERHRGCSLSSLLAAAPPEEGLAGALYALSALGVVELGPGAPERATSDDPADAVEASLRAAHALAEEGSYFQVLGVDPRALPRELRAAYESRREELDGMDLAAIGLERLAPERRCALEVVDEAYEILSDDELRAAYTHALGL